MLLSPFSLLVNSNTEDTIRHVSATTLWEGRRSSRNTPFRQKNGHATSNIAYARRLHHIG
jgi:hypothetical protein